MSFRARVLLGIRLICGRDVIWNTFNLVQKNVIWDSFNLKEGDYLGFISSEAGESFRIHFI